MMRMPASIHTERYRRFRKKLAELRGNAGLTQRDVAKRLHGFTQAMVGKLETGDRRMDIVEFVDWCEVVGVKPSEVLKELFEK